MVVPFSCTGWVVVPNLQLTTEWGAKPHPAVLTPVPVAEREAVDTPSSRAGDQPGTLTGPWLLLSYWVLVFTQRVLVLVGH